MSSNIKFAIDRLRSEQYRLEQAIKALQVLADQGLDLKLTEDEVYVTTGKLADTTPPPQGGVRIRKRIRIRRPIGEPAPTTPPKITKFKGEDGKIHQRTIQSVKDCAWERCPFGVAGKPKRFRPKSKSTKFCSKRCGDNHYTKFFRKPYTKPTKDPKAVPNLSWKGTGRIFNNRCRYGLGNGDLCDASFQSFAPRTLYCPKHRETKNKENNPGFPTQKPTVLVKGDPLTAGRSQ